MFQEFRTKNRTHAYLITFISYLVLWIAFFFFFINFFSKPLFPLQRFDFKNSIIAIKLYGNTLQ